MKSISNTNNGTLTRREFLCGSVALAATAAVAANSSSTDQSNTKIINYNPNMEYRRCGKTDQMISCVG
ncbi:MAG: hypothetical protein M1608_05905, partial [Candidatus Omnitrophica bacterium]|nr:hypothetical protein [Candidatus Omnitrophota bacterium]